jgi:hypothetical protein
MSKSNEALGSPSYPTDYISYEDEAKQAGIAQAMSALTGDRPPEEMIDSVLFIGDRPFVPDMPDQTPVDVMPAWTGDGPPGSL